MITNNPDFLKKVILSMAEEKYKEEIVSTAMEELSIGAGKDWDSKEDWISYFIADHFNQVKTKLIDPNNKMKQHELIDSKNTIALRLYSLDVGQEFEYDNFTRVIRVPGGWVFKRGLVDLTFIPFSEEFSDNGGMLVKEFIRSNPSRV